MKSKQQDAGSLFSYYVRAAFIAARMGVSLEYAFRTYVKPGMPQDKIKPFTAKELSELKDHF